MCYSCYVEIVLITVLNCGKWQSRPASAAIRRDCSVRRRSNASLPLFYIVYKLKLRLFAWIFNVFTIIFEMRLNGAGAFISPTENSYYYYSNSSSTVCYLFIRTTVIRCHAAYNATVELYIYVKLSNLTPNLTYWFDRRNKRQTVKVKYITHIIIYII